MDIDKTCIQYQQIGKIFDLLSLGVIVLSRQRRIISMNQAAESLTGQRFEKVEGCLCYKIFLDYLCGGKCKFLDSPNNERETLVSEINITDQENQTCCITKIESPIYDADRRLVGCIEVFQDNSAFKELIKRIRFDDLRFKLILDNLDIGILTVDRGRHISFFNTKAEQLTGYSRSDLLGKPCKNMFGEAFCKDFLDRKAGAKDVNRDREIPLTTRQGQVIPVRTRHLPLKNEKGAVVGGLSTLSDLSLQHQLDQAIQDRYTFHDMVGKAPGMQRLFDIIPVVAASDATVLIEGPTGTGKDLLAKIIHNASLRSRKKLIKVNCASLPDNLLESEMFGYVRGAFTGADRDKPGRFQLADGGTIFLDEIGDLPLPLQAKLLRVLEDREFYPLGSRQTTQVDVRILSATNQNLVEMVKNRQFREDLFYRLNVMRLELPALKERKSDLPLLIPHILKNLCLTRGSTVPGISEAAMSLLFNYDYPGNVRELENILEHALIICRGESIDVCHFPLWLTQDQEQRFPHTKEAAEESEEKKERALILDTLHNCHWNRSQTARTLSMDRTTLWRKMKKYKIAQ